MNNILDSIGNIDIDLDEDMATDANESKSSPVVKIFNEHNIAYLETRLDVREKVRAVLFYTNLLDRVCFFLDRINLFII